ncbi:hypothetical protein D3C85_1881450 [compost metagenome]
MDFRIKVSTCLGVLEILHVPTSDSLLVHGVNRCLLAVRVETYYIYPLLRSDGAVRLQVVAGVVYGCPYLLRCSE